MKFAFIHSHRSEHTITKMCEVLGVSKSGYYEYVKRLDREETDKERSNRKLDERIKFHFHDNHGIYGSPRIHIKLVKGDQLFVSQKKVANRMRKMGLFATPPKKYVHTTDSDHTSRVHKNILDRKFKPNAPNQVWATDITYIHPVEGFIYFNPILDLYAKRIISYGIDDSMEETLPLRALEKAISLRNPKKGWMHHSDQGAQYCSKKYIEKLEEAGATISMSRKANPYDNACVESFFASLKKEFIYKSVFKTKAEAIGAIQFYVEFYNRKRMHSQLGYATPLECELAYKEVQRNNA